MGRHSWLSKENRRWRYRGCGGGELRKKRSGRKARWLKPKKPLHLVLRANNECIKTGFRSYKRYFIILKLMERYSRMFHIKIEQFSIQYNHIHLLIRTTRRSHYQDFFRVFAGQIAQVLEKEGLLNLAVEKTKRRKVTGTPQWAKLRLWKFRPFTRVLAGWKAFKVVREYIQLNELEGLKIIPHRSTRLKGLSTHEWELIRGWARRA